MKAFSSRDTKFGAQSVAQKFLQECNTKQQFTSNPPMSARDGPNEDREMFEYRENGIFDRNFGSVYDPNGIAQSDRGGPKISAGMFSEMPAQIRDENDVRKSFKPDLEAEYSAR